MCIMQRLNIRFYSVTLGMSILLPLLHKRNVSNLHVVGVGHLATTEKNDGKAFIINLFGSTGLRN